MKEIFSKRLKSARTLAGLSQDQLVEKMGHIVSKNAISKYEKGEMMADENILLALATALDVKPDYFFRPFNVEIEKVEFRKKHNLKIKDINSIRQKVTDFIEKYLEVEQFLNIETSFKKPEYHASISNLSHVEEAAKKLRQEWNIGIDALGNVIDLLESHQIKVIEIPAAEAFDGFSGWADGRIPIIVLNKNFNSERKRLTSLHELGHLILDFDKSLTEKNIEKLCFQFAGAMLLPESTIKTEIGERRSAFSLPELISVKEKYGISIQAFMARALDLEIITGIQFTNFRKRINSNRTEEGMGCYAGREESSRLYQLIYRAAAEEVISLSKAANLANLKLTEFRKLFFAW